VRTLLGYDIDEGEMRAILKRLACEVAQESGAFRAKPPTWRFDLAIEEDFVEEIARIHGYEHVPSTPPRSGVPMLRFPKGAARPSNLRHLLAALGYQEVVNYSFVAEAWEADFANNPVPVRLANPIASTMSVMRTTSSAGSCRRFAPTSTAASRACALSRSGVASRVRRRISPSSRSESPESPSGFRARAVGRKGGRSRLFRREGRRGDACRGPAARFRGRRAPRLPSRALRPHQPGGEGHRGRR
jgi:hypothetical protein